MESLPYEIVDVFTDRPFTGNPLAVVFDADALTTWQMQTLALEFHLSETVFILPPTRSAATYRARIFTPEAELPFAGHPSVGAAVTRMRRGGYPPGTVVQECGAGLLPIEVYPSGAATLRGGHPTVGPELDPETILAAVGLTVADYAGPAPRLAGCGLEFHYMSVQPEALDRAMGDVAAARASGVAQISVFAWDAAAHTALTRVFCPGLGIPEDPATGSAALGFGVWLVASGLLPGDAESSYTVLQGAAMLRPSTLACTVAASGGMVTGASVTGSVVPIARGEIAIPPL